MSYVIYRIFNDVYSYRYIKSNSHISKVGTTYFCPINMFESEAILSEYHRNCNTL